MGIFSELKKMEEEKKAVAGAPTVQSPPPPVQNKTRKKPEKNENYKEAIAAYEKFLEIAPNHKQAPEVKSIIEQLRLQMNQ